jgi:2-amino-4-hydroxy-6-hydroxymethyldihydropteridine diphosphokinase
VVALYECLIALGGNLQISGQVFNDALARLQLLGCSGVEMSRVLKTRPVGVEAGQEFLNAAAVLHTDQSPDELLSTLHQIEATFHRVRTRHWGPRTLDLDLILYGNWISDMPQLVVPHPAMWYRRFVLEPAIDVAAHMVHPTLNESVAGLHKRLMFRPLRLEICSGGSATENWFLDAIMHHVRESRNEETEWHPTDPASVIAQDSFARIMLRQGKELRVPEKLNRKGREIEVSGTVAEVLSQIEHLSIAMLG